MKKVLLVPMGARCGISFLLENLHIYLPRTPFEWMTTLNLRSLIMMLQNEFRDFLRKDHIPILTKKFEDGQIAFENDYGIRFEHDARHDKENNCFVIDEAEQDKILEKYDRRCKRLLKNIQEADKIIFVRIAESFRMSSHTEGWHHTYEEGDFENGVKTIYELKDLYPTKEVHCCYLCSMADIQEFSDYISAVHSDPDITMHWNKE
jgi:hypothetical protein